MKDKKTKPQYVQKKSFFKCYKIMHIYCKNCKKHPDNTFQKKLVLISKKKIKGKSNCA